MTRRRRGISGKGGKENARMRQEEARGGEEEVRWR